MRTYTRIGSLIAALALFTLSAQAQTYPSKPINVVIGFTAGGTTDVIMRLVGERLTKTWGQPIIIDNKPGAGGNIAAELVAKAKSDGYTLLMSSGGPLTVNVSLYKSLPYDAQRDFAPVTQVVDVPNMLVVTPSVQAKTVQEFVALAKADPNKYFFATTGNGTQSHLTAEMFKQRAGINLTHVPYRGAVALTDLLSGQSVHCMFATTPSVIQYVRSGKLRALAVTGLKRATSAPDLPTIAESGYPDFDSSSWFGLVGPAGMPHEVVAKIQSEIARAMKDSTLHAKLVQMGADPVGSTAEEFGAFMRAETVRWGKVVKAAHMSVD